MNATFRFGFSLIRSMAKPGWLAWLPAFVLVAAGWLLAGDARGRLLAAPLLVTAVGLLATARNWSVVRRQAEMAMLFAGLVMAGVLLAKAPAALRVGLTPVVLTMTVLAVLVIGEWRFAPDDGQAGMRRAFVEAAYRTLWAGCGMGGALGVLACYASEDAWHGPLLTGLGAFWGYGCSVWRRPRLIIFTRRPRIVSPHDAADWWKDDI
jgi:hypothetical protein